jgi:hypothetical protein
MAVNNGNWDAHRSAVYVLPLPQPDIDRHVDYSYKRPSECMVEKNAISVFG